MDDNPFFNCSGKAGGITPAFPLQLKKLVLLQK